MMLTKIKAFIDTLPYIRGLAAFSKHQSVPPGHYYSPINSPEEVKKYKKSLFNTDRRAFAGIELNEAGQLELLEQFKKYYSEIPASWHGKGSRYSFDNNFYLHSDGIFLYSMMRHFKPKRIVEVGSGFSSALMLDTNEMFFGNQIALNFVEPYADRLRSILKPMDNIALQEIPVQDVDLTFFSSLEANDILFIDSSHVSKAGSDVNTIFFEILPNLKSGVIIHFHDVFFPLEYPESWLLDLKRSWNEIYMLRSFLMFNQAFEVLSFNTFLEHFHSQWFEANMPLCLKNTGGSIWLRRK